MYEIIVSLELVSDDWFDWMNTHIGEKAENTLFHFHNEAKQVLKESDAEWTIVYNRYGYCSIFIKDAKKSVMVKLIYGK